VAAGADKGLLLAERAFLYMPYMHSESAAIHALAVALFSQPGLEHNLDFELRHKAIIDRFGRYPTATRCWARRRRRRRRRFCRRQGRRSERPQGRAPPARGPRGHEIWCGPGFP
jgi:uncharacterized protein (DUF924 family)